MLFISSSVDTRTGCFHILAVMNKVATNIHVHLKEFYDALFHFPSVILRTFLSHIVIQFMFHFLRNRQFSKVTVPFHIPASKTPAFQFLHSRTSTHFPFHCSEACGCELHFIYPFPSQWTFGLFPLFTMSFATSLFLCICSWFSWAHT